MMLSTTVDFPYIFRLTTTIEGEPRIAHAEHHHHRHGR